MERLQSEHAERASAVQAVSKEIKEVTAELEKKTVQLDEKLAKSERSLRQHTLDQAKNLRDDIEQRHNQISGTLDQEVSELRTTKTDRAALSDLLREMALRLNEDKS